MQYTYEQFKNELLISLKQLFGSEYDFEFYTAKKNNSVEFDSLRIFVGKKEIHAGITICDYYITYENGKTISEISKEIFQLYDACWEPSFQTTDSGHLADELRSCLIFRLINRDKNQLLLEKVPYIPFFDLALTFHRLIQTKEGTMVTSCVTLEDCGSWHVEKEELFFFSLCNMPSLLPAQLHNIEDMILTLVGQELPAYSENQDITLSREEGHAYPMYVLSNSSGIHGASSILYPDMLENCRHLISADFYILPSSVHELILVPIMEEVEMETLKEMVRTVNENQIAEEDFLSDEVYTSIDFLEFYHACLAMKKLS